MDPNETLSELRRWADNHNVAPQPATADLLVEHFAALDEWLSEGGFLPNNWQANR